MTIKPVKPTLEDERDAQLAAQDVLLMTIIRYIDDLGVAFDWQHPLSEFLEKTAVQFDERSSRLDPSEEGFAHIQLMLAKYREIVASAKRH